MAEPGDIVGCGNCGMPVLYTLSALCRRCPDFAYCPRCKYGGHVHYKSLKWWLKEYWLRWRHPDAAEGETKNILKFIKEWIEYGKRQRPK